MPSMRSLIQIVEREAFLLDPLRSAAFRRWFAGSKIVDRHGEPLVVYHGTAAAFDAFEVSSIGAVFGDDKAGFFFTNNAADDMASGYAKLAAASRSGSRDDLTGANVIPAFVKIVNPFTFATYGTAYGYQDDWDHVSDAVVEKILDGRGLVDWFDTNKRDIVPYAIREGYDGIFLWDPSTIISGGIPENLVVAFRPDQIKSVFAREFRAGSDQLSEERQPEATVLFHHSPKSNRSSIKRHGLMQRYCRTGDGQSLPVIYLTTKPDTHGDVWAVDVTGLHLEPDYDAHDPDEYGEWWAYYDGDIPPSRLKLVRK